MFFLGLAELLGFIYITKKKLLSIPTGGMIMLALLLLNGLFCFHSPDLKNSIGYELWFIMLVGAVFLACNIFNDEKEKKELSRVFLLQSVFMAFVGYIQFIVGLFGYSFFTMQWTKLFLPRLNGFNYEPSYYASFLIIAWVFFAYSFEKKDATIFSEKSTFFFLIMVSGAIVFSTSRMGWLMLALWCGFRLVYCMVKDRGNTKRIFIIIIILLAFVFIIVNIMNLENPLVEEIEKLWQDKIPSNSLGLPVPPKGNAGGMYNGYENSSNFSERYLENSLTSSTNTRLASMIVIFRVFIKSPIIGYSLGGVLSESIKEYPDIILKLEQPNAGLFAEMLAAFGIIGFALVLIYLLLLLKKSINEMQSSNENTICAWTYALVWELGILQFNNNILRLYVWALISILSANLSCRIIAIEKGEK